MMLHWINRIVGGLVVAVTAPMAGLGVLPVLLIWSAIIGVICALVFRYATRQSAMDRAGDALRASVAALWLFEGDLRHVIGCHLSMLRATLSKLVYATPAMLIILPILILLMTHLALRFEYQPLLPGQSIVVSLTLTEQGWQSVDDVVLDLPANLRTQTPMLRDPQARTAHWRVAADQPGAGELTWRLDGQTVTKHIAVADNRASLSPISVQRDRPGWITQLIYPGEAPLDRSGRIERITLHHAPRATVIWGRAIAWWLILTIAAIPVAAAGRLAPGTRT